MAPGGQIGCFRAGRCLPVMTAKPPSVVFSWASTIVVPRTAAVADKKARRVGPDSETAELVSFEGPDELDSLETLN